MVTNTTIKKGLPDETSVKAGYKQTDLGVIPEDWSVIKLGDYVVITSGESPSKFMMQDEGIPYFKVEQLNNCIKYQEDTPYHIKGRKKVKSGSILFPKRGATIFLNKIRLLKQDSYFDTNLMALTVNDELSSEFLFYSINYLGLDKVADTTSVPQINNKHITPFILPVPSKKEEQTAIATILSDTDALIESLEKLIAKKKAIKQGAMQQLLTGKKRLPGVSGEWEVKTLGEIGKFKGGSGFPIKYQGKVESKYPFYKVSDMNNKGNQTFMRNSNNWINENTKKIIGATIFPKHTIVFAKIGAAIYLERKKILFMESCIDNNMMGFIFDESQSDYRFLHYLFLSIQLGKLVSATALPSLNGKQIAELSFAFPRKKEQTAIANILSDMDTVIEKLEQKRDKYIMLKQGMMQQLLTGRIRIYANN